MIKYVLLGLLREKPDHGYRLKKRFDERMASVSRLNAGQVYQTLQALVRAGLIAQTTVEDDSDDRDPMRPRRIFGPTPKGRLALERWLERAPRQPRPARDETLLRLLVLAPERHAQAAEQIAKLAHVYRQHATRLLADKRKLPRDMDGVTLVRAIGIEGALLHAEAHVKWLEHTRERLLGNDVSAGEAPGKRR